MPRAPCPTCRWRDCTTPGPYSDNRALFEHLVSAHNSQRGLLHCKWIGCGRRAVLSGSQDISDHLSGHTDFRPYVCAHPDCGVGIMRACELRRHIVDQHDGHAQPRALHGSDRLACRWSGCERVFPSDTSGASALWEHIDRRHLGRLGSGSGYRCHWGSCARALNSNAHFTPHVRVVPAIECTICARGFNTTSALTLHEKSSHSAMTDSRRGSGGSADGDDDADQRDNQRRMQALEDEPEVDLGRLEERVRVLEARLDALITGWRRGRGQPGADESDRDDEEDN